MVEFSLLAQKNDVFSQNGEDGIISEIFQHIGTTTRACCEFGAWDGIHFSNCRNLFFHGWSALMIEGDSARFAELTHTYADKPAVTCVNRYVDADQNCLDRILEEHNYPSLDFLSIDIDGLDYEVLESLQVRPRVICVEVNAGHNPEAIQRLPADIARNNVGQPLGLFTRTAESMGYALVCYSGNAFYVRRDCIPSTGLTELPPADAYRQFIAYHTTKGREWLYLVNLGLVEPHYRYHNPQLRRSNLDIGLVRSLQLRWEALLRQVTRWADYHNSHNAPPSS